MAGKRWTNEEISVIKEFYGKISVSEIVEKLSKYKNGRTNKGVEDKARSLGLKYDKKYSFNKDYFETIDTYDKAYWLGFIYADGYVCRNKEKRHCELGIELKLEDINHLEKFNKCIDGNFNIKTRKKAGFKKYGFDSVSETCVIRVYSSKICDDLISLGVVPNKTKNIIIPKINNDELMWAFIRGFMDGDGHISLPNKRGYGYRVGFTSSSSEFLKELKTFLERYGIKTSEIHKNERETGNSNKIEIRSKSSLLIYLKNVYSYGNCYLDRKYYRYVKLLELLS